MKAAANPKMARNTAAEGAQPGQGRAICVPDFEGGASTPGMAGVTVQLLAYGSVPS